MPVYIDDEKRNHNKRYVCYLTADTDKELRDFAKKAGLFNPEFVTIAPYQDTPEMVGKKWAGRQPIGHKDHYLIPFCERNRMIAYGAIPVSLGNEPWRPAMQAIWDQMYISNIEYKRANYFQLGVVGKTKGLLVKKQRKQYLTPHGKKEDSK